MLANEKTACVGSKRHGTAVHRHTDVKRKDVLWHIASRCAVQIAMYVQAKQHYQPAMQEWTAATNYATKTTADTDGHCRLVDRQTARAP